MIELGNMITIEKIVDSFVETAYHEMNPNIAIPEPVCHECTLKDEIFNNREEKDCIFIERNATVNGLMETIRKMTKERTDILKKGKENKNLKKTISDKNKEISNMKAVIATKDGMLALVQDRVAHSKNTTDPLHVDLHEENMIIEDVVKKGKKCTFTAPNMNVLGLHMENDHQNEFECNECGKKLPFKNQFKLHRR